MADNKRYSKGGDAGSNPRFKRPRKKVCNFCVDKLEIDYKDTNRLSKYISERGKILPRRMSGVCARHQRELTREVKIAREIALLPFSKD